MYMFMPMILYTCITVESFTSEKMAQNEDNSPNLSAEILDGILTS